MNTADEKAIRQALEVAERQHAEIEAKLAEIDVLKKRLAALEAYILNARELLGEPTVRDDTDVLPTNLNRLVAGGLVAEVTNPIWADAVPILTAARRPLTVAEIEAGMRAMGRSFEAEHVSEVIRSALNRRRDVFEVVGRGLYALRGWSAEMKKAPEEEEGRKVVRTPVH